MDTRMAQQPKHDLIVVGIDHTPAGSAALRWAVEEGERRGSRVLAVSVYDDSERSYLAVSGDRGEDHLDALNRANRQVVAASAAVEGVVALSLVDGRVPTSLALAAQRAALLVLGRPQEGRHEGLPAQLTSLCACPVILVNEAGETELVAVSPDPVFLEPHA